MKDFLVSLVVASVLTAFSYAVGLHFGWITTIPWLELSSVFTSYSCTYLCVRESKWNFPMGIVSVVLLGFLFYDIQLYSSMVLSLYLVPVLVVGWWKWNNGGVELPVTNITLRSWKTVAFLLLSSATYLLLWSITAYLGAKLSATDSAILLLSIVAQYLLTIKKIENWFVWFLVNNLAIYTYFSAEAYLVGIQYIFFLANTLYGYYSWNRSANHV